MTYYPQPYLYDEMRFNHHLSNRLPAALGRQVMMNNSAVKIGLPGTAPHIYTADVPSVQLYIRLPRQTGSVPE